MQKQTKFSLKSRLKSFGFALNGLKILFKEEHNARIHLFFSVLVLFLGFLCNLSLIEWILICFCIGLVIASEALNSSLEKICDLVSPEYHPLVKKSKDLAAASVLTCTLVAVIVGLCIFTPKFYLLLGL